MIGRRWIDRVRMRLAAAAVGAALGAVVLTGGPLLLYAGRGLLGSVGVLLGLVLLALAAGVWARAPRAGRRVRVGGRWLGLIALLILAAPVAELWYAESALRTAGAARAVAVVVMLAAPAYMAGMVLTALRARTPPAAGAGFIAAALAGAAIGVALAAAVLVPHLDPGAVYLMSAIVVGAAGILDARGAGGFADGGRYGMHDGIAIVTGVGDPGQVGYAVAEALLDAGARVLITDVADGVDACADELRDHGAVEAVRADLTDEQDVARVVETARDRFGRVDLLVNVAGGLSVIKTVAETGGDEWTRELDRNARTAFLMCRAALPALREAGGAIVNFAAPAGLRAEPRLGAYSAAKGAVVALTRALALEEKPNGVRVNAIAPGMIDTAQNRAAVDEPERVDWVSRDEIARVVLFLAGDAAAGITGETIHVLG